MSVDLVDVRRALIANLERYRFDERTCRFGLSAIRPGQMERWDISDLR
jgi:hypothetical protein